MVRTRWARGEPQRVSCSPSFRRTTPPSQRCVSMACRCGLTLRAGRHGRHTHTIWSKGCRWVKWARSRWRTTRSKTSSTWLHRRRGDRRFRTRGRRLSGVDQKHVGRGFGRSCRARRSVRGGRAFSLSSDRSHRARADRASAPMTSVSLMAVLAFDWTAATNIALACVAVLALLVALFQERLRQLFASRARLSMVIQVEPPDAVQMEMTDQQGRSYGKAVWVRIRVHPRAPGRRRRRASLSAVDGSRFTALPRARSRTVALTMVPSRCYVAMPVRHSGRRSSAGLPR